MCRKILFGAVMAAEASESSPSGDVVALFNASDYSVNDYPSTMIGKDLISEKFSFTTFAFVSDSVRAKIVTKDSLNMLRFDHDSQYYRRSRVSGDDLVLDGDFTIEMFARLDAFADTSFLHIGRTPYDTPEYTTFRLIDSTLYVPGGVHYFQYNLFYPALSQSGGAYLACSREGTTYKISLNGTVVHTATADAVSVSGPLCIGAGEYGEGADQYSATHYLRALRITKGVALDITAVPSLPLT